MANINPKVNAKVVDYMTDIVSNNLDYICDVVDIGEEYKTALYNHFNERVGFETLNNLREADTGKDSDYTELISKEILGLLIGCTYYIMDYYIHLNYKDIDEHGNPYIPLDKMMSLFNSAVEEFNWYKNIESVLYTIMIDASNDIKGNK